MFSFDKHKYLMTSENYFDIYPFLWKPRTQKTLGKKQKNSVMGLWKLCHSCLPNISLYQKVGNAYSNYKSNKLLLEWDMRYIVGFCKYLPLFSTKKGLIKKRVGVYEGRFYTVSILYRLKSLVVHFSHKIVSIPLFLGKHYILNLPNQRETFRRKTFRKENQLNS